jgi:hypothetical protein
MKMEKGMRKESREREGKGKGGEKVREQFIHYFSYHFLISKFIK